MADENTTPVGGSNTPPVDGDGAGLKKPDDAPVETPPVEDPAGDTVKYSTYSRLMTDHRKLKDKNKELEAAREQDQRKELESKENFKTLYENEVKSHSETKKDNADMKTRESDQYKMSAVQSVLSKRQVNCHDLSALFSLGNYELLQLDDDRKVLGAEAFLDDAIKNLGYLFVAGNLPTTNNILPGLTNKKVVTQADFDKLPKEDQQAELDRANANAAAKAAS